MRAWKLLFARFSSLLCLGVFFHATLFAQAESDSLGDLDKDGVFTAHDLARLVGHTAGTSLLAETLLPFADLNQDGVINDADHAELVKLILETSSPQALPLAHVRSASPHSGAGGVAVTRETILNFSMPLALNAVLDTNQFYAEFGGRKILARVEISSDKKKATLFYQEPLPSNARIHVTFAPTGLNDLVGRAVDPDGDGTAGGSYTTSFDTLSITALAGTAITGRVLASELGEGGADVPLQGVTVTVDGAEETLRATTDANGSFTLTPCPAGSFFVHVDGRTALVSNYPNGDYYPNVGKRWDAIAGRTDNLSGNSDDTARGIIYLPKIIAGSLSAVSQMEDTPIDFPESVLAEYPELEGTELLVPANSLFADDGTRGGQVGLAPVDPNRLPSPLPPGLELPMVITIQTDGASNFDTPVPVSFPNLPDPVTGQKLPPGAKSALFSFNHDTGEWEVVGPMTVTEDGNFVKTDAGVGVRQPGWHGTNPSAGGGGPGDPGSPPGQPNGPSIGSPGAPELPPCGPGFKDPQDLQEVQEMIAANATNAGMGIGGRLIKMLGDIPRGVKELFKFGKGARKEFQEMDKMVADAHAYRLYLEALRDFYAEYADGIGPGRPQPPCAPSVQSSKGKRSLGASVMAGSGNAQVDSLVMSYEALAASMLAHYQIEQQIQDIYSGKPEGYTPTVQEQAVITAAKAQINTHLGGLSAHEFYEPQWAQLRQKLATVTTTGIFPIPQPESAFFVLVREDNGQVVLRGRTSSSGALPNLILSPATDFVVRFFYPSTLAVAETSFTSGPTGSQSTLLFPGISAANGATVDLDGDGLSNLAESVIGTNATLADTDNDGIPDGTEIRQGSDPASGLASSTGILASVPTSGPAVDVASSNNLVVTANGAAGVSIFNVATGLNPTRVADLDTPGEASSVAISGTTAVVADGLTGLVLVDLSVLNNVRIVAQVNVGGGVHGAQVVTVSGPTAYVAMTNGTVVAVDLVSRTVLERIPLPVTSTIYDLAVWREHLYVLQQGRLTCISLADLGVGAVVPLVDQSITGWRPRLFAGEGTLYAVHSRGFHLLDTAASESNPPVLQNFITSQVAWKQLVSNGSGLALVAVGPNSPQSDPHDVDAYQLGNDGRQPVFNTTFLTPGVATALSIFNGIAYVADAASGLQVMAYQAFDTQGQAPTVALSSNFTLNQADGTGVAESGKLMRLSAGVADDVQVRNVEFYVDGVLASVDGNYPFEHRFLTPKATALRTQFKVRARATDTGGNATLTREFVVTLVPDTTPPVVTRVGPSGLTGKVTSALAFMSEALDPATVNDTTFVITEAGPDHVFGSGDDVPVTASAVTFRPEIQAASFTVTGELPPGVYQAVLTTGVKDLSNNAMAADRTWQFSVDGDPVFWTGGSSGNWTDATSWNTGVIPGPNDLVVINGPPELEVNLGGAYVQARAITTQGGARLVVAEGSSVNLAGVTLGSDLWVGKHSNVSITGGLRLENANLIFQDQDQAFVRYLTSYGSATSVSGTGEIVLGAGGQIYAEMQGILEAGITVRTRGDAHFYYSGFAPNTTNQGTFMTDAASAHLRLSNFINQGTLSTALGRITLVNNWVNNGILQVSAAGRLDFGEGGYEIPYSAIGTMNRTGGRVVIGGTLDLAGGTLALNATTGSWELFEGEIKSGNLTTADGATLIVSGTYNSRLRSVDIQGLVTVQSGALLTLTGNWANHGTVNGTNSTIRLDGEFKLSEIGNYNGTGNSVEIIGILDNTGETLMLDALPNFVRIGSSGTIKGGILSGSAPVNVPAQSDWRLDGVTVNQDLILGSSVVFYIYHGLVLNNADIIADPTPPGHFSPVYFYFFGTQSVSGNGAFQFASGDGFRGLELSTNDGSLDGALDPGVLTFEPGISFHLGHYAGLRAYGLTAHLIMKGSVNANVPIPSEVNYATAVYMTGHFTNQGTLTATAGHLYFSSYTDQPWTNLGTVNLSGTGKLTMGGDFTQTQLGTLNRTGGTVNIAGTLDNTGKTLALNAATGSWNMTFSGKILGGTLTTADGALLTVPQGVNAILESVNLQGTVEVTEAQLSLNGDWLNNGTINATNSRLDFGGEFRLSELGVINRTGGSRYITGILDNTGFTFVPDTPGAPWLFQGGTLRGGSLASAGPLLTSGNFDWTLDGVTLATDMNQQSGFLKVKNGLSMGSHSLTLNSSTVYFNGTQTINGTGARIILAGPVFAGSSLNAYPADTFNPAASTLTFGAGLTIVNQTNSYLNGYTLQQAILNLGTIRAEVAGTTLNIYGAFTNQGQLQQVNGGQIVIQP
ncbi:MAG: Ig-like domain-containing protein [Verrucomicrobiota bacterium]